MVNSKEDVVDFWNEISCGVELLLESKDKQGCINHLNARYKLETFILNLTIINKKIFWKLALVRDQIIKNLQNVAQTCNY
jgi:hypothetical protein